MRGVLPAALGLGGWASVHVFGFPALDNTTTLFAFLFLVALAVWLSAARPTAAPLLPTPADRDRERLHAELRAQPGYRPDVPLP